MPLSHMFRVRVTNNVCRYASKAIFYYKFYIIFFDIEFRENNNFSGWDKLERRRSMKGIKY